MGPPKALLLGLLALGTALAYDSADQLPFETSWLSEDAKKIFAQKSNKERAAYLQKVYEGLDAEAKSKAHHELLPGCYSNFLSHEQRDELQLLHHTDHAKCQQRIQEIRAALSPKQQEDVDSYWALCESVWYKESHEGEDHHDHHAHHHHRRHALRHIRPVRHVHTSFDDFAAEHLTWLSDAEKAEVKELHSGKDAHKSGERIIEILKASTGEKRTKGLSELQSACKELVANSVGPEKYAELKKLKEGGATHAELKKTVQSYIESVADEAKKLKAQRFRSTCEAAFELDAKSRRRRSGAHHHVAQVGQHGLDDYLNTYLAWLTDAQKERLREMKLGGASEDEQRSKILDFFDKTDGEEKEKAEQALQEGCRSLIKNVIGEKNSVNLKKMKHDGKSNAEIYQKLRDMLGQIEDKSKLEKADKYKVLCRKAFGITSKNRREALNHDLEVKFKSIWKFLTKEQMDEVRKMKKDGKSDEEILNKVFEFYVKASGKVKEEAEDGLQASCDKQVLSMVGPLKAEEFRKAMESGATPEDKEAKIKALLLANPPSRKLSKTEQNCKLVFTQAARRRRHSHEHGHDLESYLASHLSWLTDAQKAEVRQLKAEGKGRDAIQAKVMDYFGAASGEQKEKATVALQQGCKHLLASAIGKEKSEELAKMKQSGASNSEIAAKAEEMIKAAGGPQAELVKPYSQHCKTVFGVSRKRRAGQTHHHALEAKLKGTWSWLSEEQKEEVRKLQSEGKKEDVILDKVFEYFNAATGATKDKAEDGLQASCDKQILSIVGAQKAEEFRKALESGATPDQKEAKVKELLNANPTSRKLSKTEENCKLVFIKASRKRRHSHEHGHDLESYLASHLSWLTDDQKAEVRKLKANGKGRAEIQNKVMEYFASATGEQKEKATTALQHGCKHLLSSVIGKEKSEELAQLKKGGASNSEVAAKAEEMIKAVGGPQAEQIQHYSEHCKTVFGVGRRRRHDHQKHDLENYLADHSAWMTEAQKAELRQLKADGKGREAIEAKVLDFYKAAEGEQKEKAVADFKVLCRELLVQVVGAEKAAELKKLRESGTPLAEVAAKADAFAAAAADGPHKQEAQKYTKQCKSLFGVA